MVFVVMHYKEHITNDYTFYSQHICLLRWSLKGFVVAFTISAGGAFQSFDFYKNDNEKYFIPI